MQMTILYYHILERCTFNTITALILYDIISSYQYSFVTDTSTHLLCDWRCVFLWEFQKYNPVVPRVQGLGNEINYSAP